MEIVYPMPTVLFKDGEVFDERGIKLETDQQQFAWMLRKFAHEIETGEINVKSFDFEYPVLGPITLTMKYNTKIIDYIERSTKRLNEKREDTPLD